MLSLHVSLDRCPCNVSITIVLPMQGLVTLKLYLGGRGRTRTDTGEPREILSLLRMTNFATRPFFNLYDLFISRTTLNVNMFGKAHQNKLEPFLRHKYDYADINL